LEQRRQGVIDRFQKIPKVKLTHLQDYIDRLFPDITITLYAGEDYPSYPVGFSDAINKKFLIVGEVQLTTESFVYEFTPLPFTGGINVEQVTCVLDKIIPANVHFIFYYT